MSAITTMTELMNENERLRALLRQSEEEITRLKEKAAERRENCIAYYDEQLAELRTQLAASQKRCEEVTTERDACKLIAMRCETGLIEKRLEVESLQAQLAAMTAERDEAVRLSRYAVHDALLHSGHTVTEHTGNVFGQWQQAIQDAVKAEQQLAASQARCAQLEEALKWSLPLVMKLHHPFNHVAMVSELTCDGCKNYYKAKRELEALTPERPPA